MGHTGSHIYQESEQAALGGVGQGHTAAVFLTARVLVYTISVTIVERGTVVGPRIAATEGERVLRAHAYAAHGIEPVGGASEVISRARCDAVGTVLVSTEHVEFGLDDIERHCTVVGGMQVAVACAFLRGHEDDAVRTACTVDGTGSSVFQDIKAFDVIGVEICQVAARNTIDDDERP